MRHPAVRSQGTRAAARAPRTVLALCLALVGLGTAPRAQAVGGIVTDQAVSLFYGPSHWDGSPEATLSGVEPSGLGDLAATGWWYRIQGVDTREYPFPAPDSETYTSGVIHAHWNNVDGKGFGADERTYVFDQEGPSGGFMSIMEADNNTGSPMTLNLFHYLNGDLLNTGSGDSGLALNSRFLHFYEGSSVLRYSAQGASSYLVRPQGSGVASVLNDASVDDFDDTGLPFTGDWTAGFQMVNDIAAGSRIGFYPIVVSVNLPAVHIKGQDYATGSAFPELSLQDLAQAYARAEVMRRSEVATEIYPFLFPNSALVGVNDFDANLFDDEVTRDLTSGQVFINGGALTGAPTLSLNWKLSATQDFSADQKADILWRNTSSQKLVIWKMDGHDKIGNITPSPDHAANANWDVVGVADFNHDAFPDFLWYNQTSGNAVIWYMNQQVQRLSGAFTNPTSVGSLNWKAVAVGDFGKGPGGVWDAPDIVWQNDTSLKVVIWYMDHAGNRTSGVFTNPDTFGNYKVVGPH